MARTTDLLTNELAAALAAVRAASQVCRGAQGRLLEGHTLAKGDASPVTIADFAAQAVVCAELTDSLGAVEMIGEEDSDVLRSPDATDLLDAVVGLVATRCRHAASPDTLSSDTVLDLISVGSSAGTADRYWTLDPMAADPVAVRVAAPASLAEARLCESVESGHSNQDHSAQIAALLGITAEPYRIDSQCKYAAVARGDASIYLRLPTRADYREKIWDHAVGKFVVEQAGGVVTDVTGATLDFSCGATLAENRGVIATDGRFHTQVVDAVRAVLA